MFLHAHAGHMHDEHARTVSTHTVHTHAAHTHAAPAHAMHAHVIPLPCTVRTFLLRSNSNMPTAIIRVTVAFREKISSGRPTAGIDTMATRKLRLQY
jgi:hypothetical protein